MINIRSINNIKHFEPRRIKRYFFLWCSKGEVIVQVDNKILKLSKNHVLTITSGQYHCFKDLKNAEGFILDFTLDYMCKTEKDIELIFQNSLFCHFDYNEIIQIENPKEIENQLKNISDEFDNKPFQYLNSIHSRIELLLIEVNRAKIAGGGEVWKPEALFLLFLEFVRNNFDKRLSLNEIATQLKTTESKLNELAKIHAGKTAQNVIFGLVISEAKRILQYENKQMKEIAFALGFEDPYYFSKFFKTHTGLSPKAYRNSVSI
jgi:AraC-like DNA-binding protein